MSYEKVKSISIKNNIITINSACNNVIPMDFSSWELKGDITRLLYGLCSGDLQPYTSASNLKFIKAKNFLNDKIRELSKDEYDSFYYLYDAYVEYKGFGTNTENIKNKSLMETIFVDLDNAVNEAITIIHSRTKKDNTKYVCKMVNLDAYVYKLKKYGFSYSSRTYSDTVRKTKEMWELTASTRGWETKDYILEEVK